MEAYQEALRSAMTSGIITPNDSSAFENFRDLYGMKTEDCLVIEAALSREFQKPGEA